MDTKPFYNLTLCIVNYNGERYLDETLYSTSTQRKRFKEILLIDNASNDKSIEIIRDRFPEVKVIKLNKNFGPGVARNLGFQKASYDRILFMDNDVSLSVDCTEGLLQALVDYPLAAVAMPRVLYAKKKNQIQYDGGDCHYLGLMILRNVNQHLDKSENNVSKINSLVTACFLVDREKWGSDVPFDDTFFFNYEDHDFGLRTRIMGHEIVSVHSSHCYHNEGTIGLSYREGGNYSRMRVFCLIRNRWQIILKNYQLKTLLLLLPDFFIYEIFQLGGVIKKRWFTEWLKAVFWIITNFSEILNKRHLIQNSRKIPDREILKGGPIPFFHDLPQSRMEQLGKNLLDFLAGIYWNLIKNFI